MLEFNGIFDRPPSPPLERDAIFTAQDLQSWGTRSGLAFELVTCTVQESE